MGEQYENILQLPHNLGENRWLKERLDSLSVRESYILAAAMQRLQPATAAEAINMMSNLDMYDVYYPASCYEQLADWYFYEKSIQLPDEVREHTDMYEIGTQFEEKHPGLFIGDCYVAYPSLPEPQQYNGMNLEQCKDVGWSVRLRLASSSCPEGVWIRLPDHENMFGEKSCKPDEIALALRELEVESVSDCTLLDARCSVLPQTVNLAGQYKSPDELILDGNELGFMIEANYAECPDFVDRLSSLVEYHGKQTLKAALKLAQKMDKSELSMDGIAFDANHRLSDAVNEYRNTINLLPHSEAEETWIRERFDTMTAKESIILAAAMQRSPPENARDAINLLIDLRDYTVCAAESYYYLADYYLREHGIMLPDSVMDFTDMTQIGRMYEDEHPGLFIGEYYVAYPKRASPQLYSGSNLEACADRNWSVKLKLASKLHPEGVWLRLPDYADANDGGPDEIGIALKELDVDKVTDCALLAAICVLPEAGDLMEQYSDVVDLIYDGQNLGFVLDEQGQGDEHFREKFAAAIALEDCRTLKAVLDVAENLGYYDFVPESELSIVATEELLKQNIPPDLIDSGAIDLADYADSLLRDRGYEQMISDAYIRRAESYPQQGQNQGPQESGMQME